MEKLTQQEITVLSEALDLYVRDVALRPDSAYGCVNAIREAIANTDPLRAKLLALAE